MISSPIPPTIVKLASSSTIPKPTSLSLLADRCISMAQLKQIHCKMIVTARIHDAYAASRLLNFCSLSDSGDLNYALKFFNYTPEPNSFMWNTLIRAHASSGNPRQSLILYIDMRRQGVIPGKHTFPFGLKASSKLNCLKSCKQLHVHVLKFGLDLDLHIVNGLIRGYSVSSGLEFARKVFDESTERNLSVWTTMICGYAQNNSPDEAIELFDEMIKLGYEPHGVTLSSVLSAVAQSGRLDLGIKIHEYIEQKGIELGVILGTALVNMYVKNGEVPKAKQLFDDLKEKNIATWNAMICGLAAHGHANEAIQLFGTLENEKITPNDITLIGVLSACCHAGFFDYGYEIFNTMKKVYGVDPKIEHYGCMVDLLGRDGKLMEAEELIRGMVWKADVVIWGALLSACKECGDIEVAERAAKEICALDHDNHGAYVVLSNMYAEIGRWGDVSKRRDGMREGCLKKTPGLSLVVSDS